LNDWSCAETSAENAAFERDDEVAPNEDDYNSQRTTYKCETR